MSENKSGVYEIALGGAIGLVALYLILNHVGNQNAPSYNAGTQVSLGSPSFSMGGNNSPVSVNAPTNIGATTLTVGGPSMPSPTQNFPLFGYAAEPTALSQAQGFESLSANEQLAYLQTMAQSAAQTQQMNQAASIAQQQILQNSPMAGGK